ncbi:MAG TPA: DUF4102 domain-containing protein [Chromatiaceae bacterium]|nr:DUF4102 domain-containing protein [Chromatiaceae bacterium]
MLAMPKKVRRLTALSVKNLSESGWHLDGDGLYLQISPTGTKSWVFRYKIKGRERRQGLGAYPLHSLAHARDLARQGNQHLQLGVDPIEYAKKQVEDAKKQRAEQQKRQKQLITFKECAEKYIKIHEQAWTNLKHRSQWRNTLKTYAYPIIGDVPAQDVNIELVLAILEPLWDGKTETGTRVRQRIENIMDWAAVKYDLTSKNPARWVGVLKTQLPERNKVQKVRHFAAMPYKEISDYFSSLRRIDTVAAKTLAFTILTATRSTEAREARWSEINLDKGIWVIPAERMKADRLHRIPLPNDAIMILKEVQAVRSNEYVFPGSKLGRPISEAKCRTF